VNARTLIITAGALVALAAPTVANARMLPAKQPSKHVVKKHVVKHVVKHVTTRQGQSRQIYIYVPAPVVQAAPSAQQLEQDYNDDLIAHGLAPIDFPPSSPAAAPESPSQDVAPEGPAAEAQPASFAASTASETVATTATDDIDC
jgi:hypothetical protein